LTEIKKVGFQETADQVEKRWVSESPLRKDEAKKRVDLLPKERDE